MREWMSKRNRKFSISWQWKMNFTHQMTKTIQFKNCTRELYIRCSLTLQTFMNKCTRNALTSNNKQVRWRREERRAASGAAFICDMLPSTCLFSAFCVEHNFRTDWMSFVTWKVTTKNRISKQTLTKSELLKRNREMVDVTRYIAK